mmetsp:Transcript_11146/g.21039  ORF Transcript_11146/g.21039 Transcript_11146/m.21039 type:complete len:371 (-) Transcript_11146:636-1748(-)
MTSSYSASSPDCSRSQMVNISSSSRCLRRFRDLSSSSSAESLALSVSIWCVCTPFPVKASACTKMGEDLLTVSCRARSWLLSNSSTWVASRAAISALASVILRRTSSSLLTDKSSACKYLSWALVSLGSSLSHSEAVLSTSGASLARRTSISRSMSSCVSVRYSIVSPMEPTSLSEAWHMTNTILVLFMSRRQRRGTGAFERGGQHIRTSISPASSRIAALLTTSTMVSVNILWRWVVASFWSLTRTSFSACSCCFSALRRFGSRSSKHRDSTSAPSFVEACGLAATGRLATQSAVMKATPSAAEPALGWSHLALPLTIIATDLGFMGMGCPRGTNTGLRNRKRSAWFSIGGVCHPFMMPRCMHASLLRL